MQSPHPPLASLTIKLLPVSLLKPCSLISFFMVAMLVLINPTEASNPALTSLDRTTLQGMIDSNGYRGYWEARDRRPLTGIVITSDSYVRVSTTGNPDPRNGGSQEEVTTAEIFDVHRVQLAGKISSQDIAVLERIALSGSISSREEMEVATRYGIDGLISSDTPDWDGNERPGQAEVELAYLREGEDDIVLFPSERDDVAQSIIDEEYPVLSDGSLVRARARALLQMVEPSITSYVRFDDIDEARKGTRDSTLVVIQPRAKLVLQQSKWTLVSNYEMEAGNYLSGDFEDFLNHEVGADWGYRTSRKNQFNVAAIYRNWQNRRVDQAVEDFNGGLTDSFRHESLAFDFSWRHGNKRDRLRSEFSAGLEKTDVESDEGSEDFGYNVLQSRVAGTGYWRIRRKVTVLLDGLYQKYDYEDRDDSHQFRLSAGADFGMLKRVAGRLLVGYQTKRYVDSNDEDGGLVWNADVTWRPQKTTTAYFRSARQLVETYFLESAVRNARFGVQQHAQIGVSQRWDQSWGSDFNATYQERDFDRSLEEEETVQLTFGTNYKLSPRWTLRGDGAYTRAKAKIANDYDRWTLTFYADMRL